MIEYLQSLLAIYKYLQKMSTRPQCSLLLFHPSPHLLKVQIALNDRLPARTRMDLRKLVQQEIVQYFKQDHS